MSNSGLTLLEILLVLTIISIIISLSFYFFNFFNQSNLILEETLKNLNRFVEITREKSRLGEDDATWGIVFINSTTKNFVIIFKNDPNRVFFLYDLPNFITFTDPPNNSNKLILFEKFSGKTTSTVVIVSNKRTNSQRFICIPTSSPSFISISIPCHEF